MKISFKSCFRKFGSVVLAATIIFLFLAKQTFATSGIYTIASNVNLIDNSAAAPTNDSVRQLARDSAGNLYAVYTEALSGLNNNIFLAKSTNNGQTWTAQAVTSDNTQQLSPSIAIDSHNNIYIAWMWIGSGFHNYQIHYREYTTGVWQPIVALTPSQIGFAQYNPFILVDSHNNIYIFWYGDTIASPDHSQIRYDEYTAGAWQPIVNLTTNADYDQNDPTAAIDSHNNIHVAWFGATTDEEQSSYNFQIRYDEYTAGAWQPIVDLTTDADYMQYSPSIAVDSHDNIDVVWCGNSTDYPDNLQIRYDEFTTGAWQPIVGLTTDNNYEQDATSISLDSQNNIYVMWSGFIDSSANSQIRYDEYTAGAWQPIVNLTASADSQSFNNLLWAEYPKVDGAQTNIPQAGLVGIWSDVMGDFGDPTGFNVLDYVSSNLAWQTAATSRSESKINSEITVDSNSLTILPQTGASFLNPQLQLIFERWFPAASK